MRSRWTAVRESVRNGFWAVPTLCVTLAVLLALAVVRLDRTVSRSLALTFGAGPDGAREVLSGITTAMITFTGLVFSITIVVLQLTSSQFSPRVLRTFLRDRQTQWALGIFTATFVYTVMVLRTVRGLNDTLFVPALATTLAVVLLLVSVAVFVGYIHHISTAIQASSIIGAIGDEARRSIARRYPAAGAGGGDRRPGPLPPDGLPTLVLPAVRSGVVTQVAQERLVRLATEADVVLRTDVRLGAFVPEGAPLWSVLGEADDLDVAGVLACVTQQRDRTLEQDVGFGFRQLVDIGERALSPGINDPTTSVQVLDQLHDLLRRLAVRPLRHGVLTDEQDRVRVVLPAERFDDFLALALDGIDQWGREHRPVQERIDALLADVCAAALPEHRPAVEQVVAARAERTRAA